LLFKIFSKEKDVLSQGRAFFLCLFKSHIVTSHTKKRQ